MRSNHLRSHWTGALATRIIAAAVTGLVLTANLPQTAAAQSTQEESNRLWEGLKKDVFGDRPIKLGTGLVTLVAPKRAQDAGLVPVDIAIDPVKSGGGVKSLTLIIDVNPAPLAAKFELGKDSGVTNLSTRVRVNDYSFVRVIAETAAGELHMSEVFVKASGGCSAPAVKNPQEAKLTMGLMKLKQFSEKSDANMSAPNELQLMIRHPNNSGLQMDQITRYFIPPHFVDKLTVSKDGAMILKMEAGISISEDPNFRFNYDAGGGKEIEAEAIDTEGLVFKDKWPVEAAGL
jgi:sulfur-oxidizing protein SoxY